MNEPKPPDMTLPDVLLPYQKRVISKLRSTSCQALFIEKSRRIGLTWGLAAYAVMRAGAAKSERGTNVMYISYAREMTREFIDVAAQFARIMAGIALEVDEFLFDDGDAEGDKSIQAFRITFASGFQILALSSAPRSLRGKQGVVIIDEAAFVDSLEDLMEAALAFLIWGGQVIVCSTHFGIDNPFNLAIQDILSGKKPYEHIRIDFNDALADGLYKRICVLSSKTWSEEAETTWRQEIIDFYGDGADQELFCIPSMSSGTWLPSTLIEARMKINAPVLRLELPADFLHLSAQDQAHRVDPFLGEVKDALSNLNLKHRFALGFDVGRVSDLSVLNVLAIEQNLNRSEVLSIEMRNVPFQEQELVVSTVMTQLRARLIGAAFDATGIGFQLSENMGRKFGLRETEDGSGLVWPIKFSEDWYRQNMPPLKAAFEDDTLSLIKDREHVVDLRSVKLVRGIARVPPVREGETGKKRHGDYAIALAYFASRMAWAEYSYTPVPDPRRISDVERMRMHADDDETDLRDPYAPPLGAEIRGGLY